MPRPCLAILALATLVSPGLSRQAQRGSPSSAPQTVLENDYVSISQVDLAAGGKSSYTVPAGRSAVLIRLRRNLGLGRGSSISSTALELDRIFFLNAGETSNYPDPKSGSGVDDREIRIELKSPPPSGTFEKDAVTLDASHNNILFENDRVRVVDVHFGLGEKGPVVDKRPRVIILLNDMHADVARHEGDPPSPRDGKAGVIQWSLGGSQATMNRNETKLDNIVVEIKGKL